MNALTSPAVLLMPYAKNFTQWCEAAFYNSQIQVKGDAESPYLFATDEILDAAFAWMQEGHITSPGKQPDLAVMAGFIITDILGEGQRDSTVKLMYAVLSGKAEVKTLTRAFVAAHIEQYEMENLVALQFGLRTHA